MNDRMDARQQALALVDGERTAQLLKWGTQDQRTDCEYVAILTEEVGELAEAVLERKFGPPVEDLRDGEAVLEEATQVAAVAVAIMERELRR